MSKLKFNKVSFCCPHCGVINHYETHHATRGLTREFVYCDVQEGGCDEEIILVNKVTATIELQALKIPKSDLEK